MSYTKLVKLDPIHMFQNIDEPVEIILAKEKPDKGKWKLIDSFNQYKNATGPDFRNMGFE